LVALTLAILGMIGLKFAVCYTVCPVHGIRARKEAHIEA
jgi:hypothetical protein